MYGQKSNFFLAVIVGLLGAVVGAVLWALVSVVIHRSSSVAALFIGMMVSTAIRGAGKGGDKKFAVLGATCSLLGALLGNLLSVTVVYATARHLDVAYVLARLNVDFAMNLMKVYFRPWDIICYGFAVCAGYKYPVIR